MISVVSFLGKDHGSSLAECSGLWSNVFPEATPKAWGK